MAEEKPPVMMTKRPRYESRVDSNDLPQKHQKVCQDTTFLKTLADIAMERKISAQLNSQYNNLIEISCNRYVVTYNKLLDLYANDPEKIEILKQMKQIECETMSKVKKAVTESISNRNKLADFMDSECSQNGLRQPNLYSMNNNLNINTEQLLNNNGLLNNNMNINTTQLLNTAQLLSNNSLLNTAQLLNNNESIFGQLIVMNKKLFDMNQQLLDNNKSQQRPIKRIW